LRQVRYRIQQLGIACAEGNAEGSADISTEGNTEGSGDE
jgi:hypothetical protein